MHTVDAIIDAYESQVVQRGVSGVVLQEFLRERAGTSGPQSLDNHTAVELLRVWMEHSQSAGAPISVAAACRQVPELRFTEDELRVLQFEVDRLKQSDSIASVNDRAETRLLPNTGVCWQGFKLVEVLGQGAFAKVYLARQLTMANRHVVLKLTYRSTPESKLLARLHHSSIVPIYSEHTDGQIQGVCMPYLGNTTVADLLGEIDPTTTRPVENSDKSVGGSELLEILCERQQPITTVVNSASAEETQETDVASHVLDTQPTQQHATAARKAPDVVSLREATAQELSKLDYADAVAWIGSQVANALAHAHRNGILHCDVKPANILIGVDGQARLLDFNVSVDEFRRTQDKDAILGGTLPYMSPEQLANFHSDQASTLDQRSDIFSLGVVLLEMLTGRVPRQQVPDKPIEARELLREGNPRISPGLSAIIERCVQRRPEDRYQSADELYEDLDAHCHQLPLVHQANPSRMELWSKWRRRHPVLTSTASVAIGLSLCAALCIAGLLWRGAENRRIANESRLRQVDQLLPRAVAAITSLRGQPEILDEARSRASQVMRLLAEDPRFHDSSENQARSTVENFLGLVKFEVNNGAFAETSSADELNALLTKVAESGRVGSDLAVNQGENLWSAYAQKKPRAVVNLARGLPSIHAHDYSTHLLLGISHLDLREYDAAQESFSRCLGLRPDIEYAWFYRGIARHKSSRFDEAATDFRQALAINAGLSSAHYNLALALEAMGLLDEAISELNTAIDSGWQSVLGYSVRARLNQRLGRIEEAQADIRSAVEMPPRTLLDWVQRGVIKMGYDPNAAERDLLRAVQIDPNHLETRQNLAHLYAEKLGDPQKSIEQLDQLVKLDPSNPMRWSGRGVVLAREGRLDGALDDLSHAASLPIENPMVAYQIASGFALIAGALSLEKDMAESELGSKRSQYDECLRAAIRWYSFAVRKNPGVAAIARTDNDIAWLREQDAFVQVDQALATLTGQPTSP